MKPAAQPFLPHSARPGFTLIEILTVIAIIAVLMGILIPATMYALGKARDFDDMSMLNQLRHGLKQYRDATSQYPDSNPASWDDYENGAEVLYRVLAGKTYYNGVTQGPFVDSARNSANADLYPGATPADPVFVDRNGMPILYFSARAGADQAFQATGSGDTGRFVAADNTAMLAAGLGEPTPLAAGQSSGLTEQDLWSAKVMLVSAGSDCKFGTEDDVIIVEGR